MASQANIHSMASSTNPEERRMASEQLEVYLGKVSIYKEAKAEKEEYFIKEMEEGKLWTKLI